MNTLFAIPPAWKCSVSTIDQFTKIGRSKIKTIDGTIRLFDENDFIKYITEPRTNFAMARGSALHAILQEPEKHIQREREIYRKGSFQFSAETIEPALATLNPIRSKTVWEHAKWRIYDCGEQILKVSARADGIQTQKLIELKTTRKFYESTYADSWQWRFYLDIFDKAAIDYWIFELHEEESIITGIHRLHFDKPNHLHQNCQEWATKLCAFVKENRLEKYFS